MYLHKQKKTKTQVWSYSRILTGFWGCAKRQTVVYRECMVLSVLLSFLAYLQMAYFQNSLLGWVLLFFFLQYTARWWKKIYLLLLPASNSLVVWGLSWFTPFILVGWLVGIFVAWYRVTPLVFSLCLFLTAFFSYSFFHWIQKNKGGQQSGGDIKTEIFLHPPGMLQFFYLLLFCIALFFLFPASNGILQTPWQHLSPSLLVIFFLLTVILGLLLFSTLPPSRVLFFIILHSFFLHSYLPLSHTLPWGGDVWRTVAVEETLLEGKPVLPVLFGSEVKYTTVGSWRVPEALVIPHKYVYSHLWGETVLLSRLATAHLLTLNRFLVPVVWSIIVPLLVFALGQKFFQSRKTALFFSFLTFLPFPLQALGGLTLAVSWGLPVFLLLLFLWLEYIENRNKSLLKLVLFLGVLSVFGYSLYFLLFWLIVLITLSFHLAKNSSWAQKLITVFWLVTGGFFFPLIEWGVGLSQWKVPPFFGLAIKQFVGEWSGWFYTTLIRPHDILSGNVIFNHTPQAAFVSNIFTTYRFHLMILMFVLGVFFVIGFYSLFRSPDQRKKLLFFFSASLFGSYIVGWYGMAGEHSFVRRLDPLLAIVILLVFLLGFEWVRKKRQIIFSRPQLFLFIVFWSFSATTIYASGPDMRVVSRDEYAAARFVADQVDPRQPACVLADTWVLLPLEAETRGRVVGGGFPIDAYFGQKERAELYNTLLTTPNESIRTALLSKTGVKTCLVVAPKNSKNSAKIKEIFGNTAYQNTTLSVFKVNLKTGEN